MSNEDKVYNNAFMNYTARIKELETENAELIRQNNDYGKEKEIFKQALQQLHEELKEKEAAFKINYDRIVDEAKSNNLKIEAYPRHLSRIAELEKENEELTEKNKINCKRAEESYNREIEVTKELVALKEKWNKVVQEVEKASHELNNDLISSKNDPAIELLFPKGQLASYQHIISLLKLETKQEDKEPSKQQDK